MAVLTSVSRACANFFFWFTHDIERGGNLLVRNFERNSNIRSNLFISLLPRNLHYKSLQSPLPVYNFSCASKVVRSPHGSKTSRVEIIPEAFQQDSTITIDVVDGGELQRALDNAFGMRVTLPSCLKSDLRENFVKDAKILQLSYVRVFVDKFCKL